MCGHSLHAQVLIGRRRMNVLFGGLLHLVDDACLGGSYDELGGLAALGIVQ